MPRDYDPQQTADSTVASKPTETAPTTTLGHLEARFGAAALQRKLALRRVQRKAAGGGDAEAAHVQRAATGGVAGAAGELPHLSAIQRSFGRHDVGGVGAHVGGKAETATAAIGAEAYAMGDQVAFNSAPSLHTAAHEAAHVVQQRAGVHLKGGVGEEGDPYEQHADAVADKVVKGESAESLLDAHVGAAGRAADGSGAVQRTVRIKAPSVKTFRGGAKNAPKEVASDPGFLKLQEHGSTYEFESLEDLQKTLAEWKDKETIPPELTKRIRETDCDLTASKNVKTDLDNCGATSQHLIGRINDAGGEKKVKVYFNREYLGAGHAKDLYSDLVVVEEHPVIMRVTIDTGIHEFTLEKLGDKVVMQQGYQGNIQFNAIWWGDPTNKKGPDVMEQSRAMFGGGQVISADSIALPLSTFLGRDRYYEGVEQFKALPFPYRDAQMQDMFRDREKKILIKVEKYRIPPEAAKGLPGDGWLTNRVIDEAKKL